MPAWFSLPKTLVEGTKARAADMQEDFQAVSNALLYLLSEEEHSIFPQLKEAAKRILAMSGDVTLDTGSSTRTLTAREDTTLKGSGGTSDFLQLLGSAAKRRVSYGTGSTYFSEASLSDIPRIYHGLGVTPQFILLTTKYPAVNLAVESMNSEYAEIRGVWCWDGYFETGYKGFYWMAIG